MWRELTRDVWRTRLKGVQRNVDVWQALLSVRQLVLPLHEDTHTYLKFASLCRKSGRVRYHTSDSVFRLDVRIVAIALGRSSWLLRGVVQQAVKHAAVACCAHVRNTVARYQRGSRLLVRYPQTKCRCITDTATFLYTVRKYRNG